MPKKKSPKGKRGRPAQTVKIEGDWKDAVKQALKRGKPLRGNGRVGGGTVPEKRDAEGRIISYRRETE